MSEKSEKLEREIKVLEDMQESIFDTAYRGGGRRNAMHLLSFVAIFSGLAGVISVLQSGISPVSGIAIAVGMFFFVSARGHDRKVAAFREMYQENRLKLEGMRDELSRLRVDPVKSEKEWLDLLRSRRQSDSQ